MPVTMSSEGLVVILLAIFSSCSGIDYLRKDKSENIKYNDCNDVLRHGINESGYYMVHFNSSEPFQVYCRFGARGSGIPIMQQTTGSVNFARGWNDYENGFGFQSTGDFWIGLNRIKTLTDNGYQILTVTLQDWNYNTKVIQYNYFVLGPSIYRYPLYIGRYVSGHILPDDLSFGNGRPFATIDRPDHNNCAYNQKGGWWYNDCTYTLPTGRYYPNGPYRPASGFYDGIFYRDWRGYGYSLKSIRLELYRI